MASVQATRLKRGMLIKVQNDLFRVLELQHFTPGNKRGFVQAKMRNIRTGLQADNKFRAEEDVERAIVDERQMQYLYRDGDSFHFMDTENYNQLHITQVLADNANYWCTSRGSGWSTTRGRSARAAGDVTERVDTGQYHRATASPSQARARDRLVVQCRRLRVGDTSASAPKPASSENV